jgi:hypothetical protein
MKTIQRAGALLISLLLIMPGELLPQARSQNDWLILQRLTHGAKLHVNLKRGGSVNGRFVSSTETTLTLSARSGTRDVNQTDVKAVFVELGKSVGKTTLKGTAIGAGTGAVVGAALGEDCTRSSGVCLNRGGLAAIGAVLFAIPGAIIGLVVGSSKHHRQLIYEA